MMKSTRNFMQFLAVALVTGALFAPSAEATPIISVSAPSNANVGDTITADIVVSNLDPGTAVGGVSFDLSFNDSVLQGTGFALDPNSKMSPIIDFGTAFGASGTSPFETIFISGLDSATLVGLQSSGSFTAATLTFQAIGPGLSELNLSVAPTTGIFLSDVNGIAMTADASNGSVCVADPTGAPVNCAAPSAVPEPATFGLLATGVAALVRRRRKAQK